MPKCTIDGREVEVAPGTTVIKAALQIGIHIPHFCWHPDLSVDGNCRMCLVEVEKMPKLQIACNTVITDGMVVRTESEKAAEAHRTTLEFLLLNHPIDCPVCDQAGECYLQDQYMDHGLHDSKVQIEEKVKKRKVVDLGPIVLDAERCVLCSRCLRYEKEVTGTNSLEFQNRGDHTQIGSFQNRPIEHAYAGNLADVCPVGALLSRDFRFKMRVWFLEPTESVCPGCSTGCNIYLDHRDGELQRFRPRRNPDVNKSWLCDPGRNLYNDVGSGARLTGARVKTTSGWEGIATDEAFAVIAEKLRYAGKDSAFVATPMATNEELFAFRSLADAAGGLLDFRVGDPQKKVREKLDEILQHTDRNPNTQGCLDLGMGRSGLDAILKACAAGSLKALVLQGPELIRATEAKDALAKVPFVLVMATHEEPLLEHAHMVLPAAMWAETDGTFTNFQRRVQRIRRAFGARPGALALRAGGRDPEAARQAARGHLGPRAVRPLAKTAPDYAGLDHRGVGPMGKALPLQETA